MWDPVKNGDSLVTAITFSFTVSINCFMACTVRLLLCSLPLIFYSPVSTPPTAVGLWNVTKNCNGQPLYACGRQFVNFAGGLPDYWRVGPRRIGRLIAQPPCECVFYDKCNLIQRMWNKLGRQGALRYLFYRVPSVLLFSTHVLYKNNSGNRYWCGLLPLFYFTAVFTYYFLPLCFAVIILLCLRIYCKWLYGW